MSRSKGLLELITKAMDDACTVASEVEQYTAAKANDEKARATSRAICQWADMSMSIAIASASAHAESSRGGMRRAFEMTVEHLENASWELANASEQIEMLRFKRGVRRMKACSAACRAVGALQKAKGEAITGLYLLQAKNERVRVTPGEAVLS